MWKLVIVIFLLKEPTPTTVDRLKDDALGTLVQQELDTWPTEKKCQSRAKIVVKAVKDQIEADWRRRVAAAPDDQRQKIEKPSVVTFAQCRKNGDEGLFFSKR